MKFPFWKDPKLCEAVGDQFGSYYCEAGASVGEAPIKSPLFFAPVPAKLPPSHTNVPEVICCTFCRQYVGQWPPTMGRDKWREHVEQMEVFHGSHCEGFAKRVVNVLGGTLTLEQANELDEPTLRAMLEHRDAR
jgi:hypothetical protein